MKVAIVVSERRDETARKLLDALDSMQGALDAMKEAATDFLASAYEEKDEDG